MLPWYVRSLGVIKIGEAMQPGAPAMPKASTPLTKGTNAPSPTASLTNNTNATLAQNVMNNQDLFAPKLGADKHAEIPTQSVMNLATNLGDDAITLAIRQMTRNAQTGLAVPAAIEKVQQINNPEEYASSQFSGPSFSQLRRALGFIGKLASAGNCQAAPEAAGVRPLLPNAAGNAIMRSDVVTNAIGQNADSAVGSFPKNAGEGNAQGVLSGNLPHRGISQNAAATARPELSTEFDKMKAFTKNETPPMNSLGQGGDVVP